MMYGVVETKNVLFVVEMRSTAKPGSMCVGCNAIFYTASLQP